MPVALRCSAALTSREGCRPRPGAQGLFSWQSTAFGVLLAVECQPGHEEDSAVLAPLLLAAHAAAGTSHAPGAHAGLPRLAHALHAPVSTQVLLPL